MKKKTVKLVSAVVVLGVLCAAYEGVNFYVTSQEEKETEENDTSVDLVSLEADDITAVSFTADKNEVEFDKKDDSWTEKSDANFPVNQDTVDSAVKGVASLTADQEISDVEDMSPTHHMAAATGRHIDTILKVAKIFNIPVDIVTR